MERLSNTENESNCTSAARSGATEIMDLLGDSWLKNSLDSSNQLINPYSYTSTPRDEEFKDIQLRSHMILNQDCFAPVIEMKNRRSQETGTIIKTNLPKKIDYVNEKVSNEVTSIVSTKQNPSERQISVDLVPEEAVFTNDNNDFVLPQTCNLSSSDSKEIVNINECEFIILEEKLTDIMIDDLEKGLNYIDVNNNNNNNPECNSLNIACNPIDSSKFTEFSTNSSTINENNINETYTITPKPQMPKIVEMVILQPGDPLYDIKNLGKKCTLLDAQASNSDKVNEDLSSVSVTNGINTFIKDRLSNTENYFSNGEDNDLQDVFELDINDLNKELSLSNVVASHNETGIEVLLPVSETNDICALVTEKLPQAEKCSNGDENNEIQDVIPLPEDEEDEEDLHDTDYLPNNEELSSDEDECSDTNDRDDKNVKNTTTDRTSAEGSNLNTSSFSSTFAKPGKSAIPATGLKVPMSLGKSGKSKGHYCYFCNIMQMNFARHVERIHANESLVKLFTSLRKKSIERLRVIAVIRKLGDFVYNTDENHNKGFFIPVRRCQQGKELTAEDFVNCPKCSGFYTRNNIRHHYAECSQSTKSTGTRSLLQNAARKLGRIHKDANYKMRHAIVPVLKKNCEVTNVIRYDRLIILFGNLLSIKYKRSHQDAMIRSQLRLLGRLVLSLRKINRSIEELADAFHPSFFEDVLKAVNDVAAFDETTQRYGSPSTATAIGTALKKCSLILKCEYIVMMDKTKKELVEDFMIVFKTRYGICINKNVAETQMEMQRKKKVVLPSNQDINTLLSFLEEERDSACERLQKQFSIDQWKCLNEVLLVYLMVFNRKRRGEIQLLTVEDFNNRQQLNEDDDIYKALTEDEKVNAKEFTHLLIRGKLGRSVPVLVCEKSLDCMNLLNSNRKLAGVNEKNIYFFAIPSTDGTRCRPLEACKLVRKYSELCGAAKPKTLRGTTLRKQLATKCATTCTEKQIVHVADFMGHDLKIHKEYYQLSNVAVDVAVSNVLKSAKTPQSGTNLVFVYILKN